MNTICEQHVGQRIDNYLFFVSRMIPKSRIYRGIRSGEVRINGSRVKPAQRLALGDRVRIPPWMHHAEEHADMTSPGDNAIARRLDGMVLYEDAQLLVLNKPSGIAVHGGSGVDLSMLAAIHLWRADLSDIQPVHRLDRGTSGVWVLAKNRTSLLHCHAQLRERTAQKLYLCLGDGHWTGEPKQWVDLPLLRTRLASGERGVVVDREHGESASTQFACVEQYSECCLLEARPKTGRMHQIRVHAGAIGHLILGDSRYGYRWPSALERLPRRLYLHARQLRLVHPVSGQHITFEAPFDARFEQALKHLSQAAAGNVR